MARPHDVGGGRQVPLGDVGVPVVARPKAPIDRPQRSSSRRTPDSSSAGRSPTVHATGTTAASVPLPPAFCPYCALLLEPAPASSQRCVRCRQRIIVKHIDGRVVYLTEAAVPVFVAERRRIAASGRLTRERERWLRLAAAAGAPVQSQERLAAARLSEASGRVRPHALPDHRRPCLQGRETRPRLGGGVASAAREGDRPVPRRRLASAASGRPRRDLPRGRRGGAARDRGDLPRRRACQCVLLRRLPGRRSADLAHLPRTARTAASPRRMSEGPVSLSMGPRRARPDGDAPLPPGSPAGGVSRLLERTRADGLTQMGPVGSGRRNAVALGRARCAKPDQARRELP